MNTESGILRAFSRKNISYEISVTLKLTKMPGIPRDLLKPIVKTLISCTKEELSVKERENIEIEARLGKIVDINSNERISLSTPHPVLIKSLDGNYRFRSGVSEEAYDRILSRFKDNEHKRVLDRVIVHKNGRYTFIDGKISSSIKKVRLKSFEIYNPYSEYDIRVSIRVEHPIEFKPIVDKRAIVERNRDRTSFLIDGFSFDFTNIQSRDRMSYEIEVEVVDLSYNKDDFISIMMNLA